MFFYTKKPWEKSHGTKNVYEKKRAESPLSSIHYLWIRDVSLFSLLWNCLKRADFSRCSQNQQKLHGRYTYSPSRIRASKQHFSSLSTSVSVSYFHHIHSGAEKQEIYVKFYFTSSCLNA